MAGHVIYVHDTIPAPPEQVWEVITDVGSYDRILRSVTGSRLMTEDGFEVGTAWHERRTIFGHHGDEELHVVECHPPRRALVETRLGNDTVRTAYSLTPAGGHDDQTKISMTTTVEMKDRSPVGNLAWKFFGGFSYDSTKRMLQHDLEDIEKEVARRSSGHDRV
jgi:uncharacterized protein YndB with AHSA1/START domain